MGLTMTLDSVAGNVHDLDREMAPATVGVEPGDRLLAVRGSSRALGFVAHGPIYDEALKHPELACFGEEARP
jgi:hypothetical protein